MNIETKKQRMQKLVKMLNQAAKAYYQDAAEIMSNYEYDALYDELENLEKELGLTLSDSPTVRVGYEVLSELPKERHESPMLSLDKTKEIERLKEFLGNQKALISWKLDGLTIVLTYRDGELYKAVTRGNGEVGEVITNNAKVFKNLPLKIAYKGELILRGEAVIRYEDFETINEEIEDAAAKYKNPRNLCSGSVRQLNNEITAKRNVRFYAFSLVKAEEVEFENSRKKQLEWLAGQGFEVVEHYITDVNDIEERVAYFAGQIEHFDVPSDGLVLVYDDIAYGQSLGRTSKFPRDSFAFKWADEIRETTLTQIEWSPSRTGLINPVAIFEPVELEGTTVSRASVHNISIMEELELGIGDKIEVYKANMIIPQIAENLTRSGMCKIPENCPVCGGDTQVKQVANAKALYCINPQCQAKHVKAFTLFVSRDAMNIDGLSEATLEKFIVSGFIKEYADIFHLDRYEEEIKTMEGFGEKSYENLIASINESRNTTFVRFVVAMDIPLIGRTASRILDGHFYGSLRELRLAALDRFDFTCLEGIGDIMSSSLHEWFRNPDHLLLWGSLQKELHFENGLDAEASGEENNMNKTMNSTFAGCTIVATGKLENFTRDGINAKIISLGATPGSSVTKKTDYLICGEKAGSKLAKAQQLGVKILTEQEFLEMLPA